MDDLTRRAAFRKAAASGLLPALAPGAGALADDKAADDLSKTERGRVTAVGMTEGEADCWLALAEAAGKFFELPELHPMDKQEVASAIHIVQNKLLSRPTYRRYLEAAKRIEAERKAAEKK